MHFHYAVHFCHQAVEKVLKAIIQERTDDVPLKTHNFMLLCKQAGIELPLKEREWLFSLAPHYLGTKYPEDLSNLYKEYTRPFGQKIFKETEEFIKWLKRTYLTSERS